MVNYVVKYLVLTVVKNIINHKKHFLNALNIVKSDKKYFK